MKVTIIGTGRAGSALAFGLKRAGYIVHALVNHDISTAVKIGRKVGCRNVSKNTVRSSVAGTDIIIISAEDSGIKKASAELRKLNVSPDTVVLHTSGVFSSDELINSGVKKDNLGSFHPVQTIPFISFRHSKILEGIYFGIEGGKKAAAAMKKMAASLKSKYIIIPGKAKAEYHLSCVLASNFVISNFYINELLSKSLGITAKKLFESQKPLLMSTIENIHRFGAVKSITGPVSRGDEATLRLHLDVLHRKYPEFIEYYKSVSGVLLKAAARKDKRLNTKKIIKLIGR